MGRTGGRELVVLPRAGPQRAGPRQTRDGRREALVVPWLHARSLNAAGLAPVGAMWTSCRGKLQVPQLAAAVGAAAGVAAGAAGATELPLESRESVR